MYYFVMYGMILLGIIAMIFSGIRMLTIPEEKVVLKPGQTRETVVSQMRKQGKFFIGGGLLILIVIGVMLVNSWSYIPGIKY